MVAHWDFGYGPAQLKKLSGMLNYPVLGINVYTDAGSLFLQPYVMITTGGVKIAVIGICCDIIDKTMPKHFSEGLKFTDGTAELPGYIKEVKEEGADLVFLLSHNGFPQDVALLNKIDGVDVCLSAHTHNRLYEPVTVNKTILIQCGCHGSFAGHLQLKVKDKQITGHQYELLQIGTNYAADQEISGLISSVMEPYRQLQTELVGETDITLHRYQMLTSNMDDFLLAAVCEATGPIGR
ncbi:MAG: hypothetical protein NVSMB24_35250 [Mucilaginibacter sp.]